VSMLHQATLVDGRRIVLLDDRGWTSESIRSASAEELRKTARVVVGPDDVNDALPTRRARPRLACRRDPCRASCVQGRQVRRAAISHIGAGPR
jgi:hypothetical protein